MRRFLLTAATAASALAVISCNDMTGIRGDVAGRYELITIDGQPLPATITHPDVGSVTFFSGEIELDNDGSFFDTYAYRFAGDPDIEEERVRGTWERDGSFIRFEATNGDVYRMERTTGNRLVYENETDGSTWVYRRL
jgi:hypothetical protein